MLELERKRAFLNDGLGLDDVCVRVHSSGCEEDNVEVRLGRHRRRKDGYPGREQRTKPRTVLCVCKG